MQSGELLVDMMKLQNILNFELHKMLRTIAPDLLQDHVLIKDAGKTRTMSHAKSECANSAGDNKRREEVGNTGNVQVSSLPMSLEKVLQ